MEEAGYPHRFRIAFDRAALSFYREYRRRVEKTKQVPLDPAERLKNRKPKPTKTVAYYEPEEIFDFIGINEADDPEAVAEVMAELTQQMWDELPDDDEEEETEPE